jgi:hypothetical protein
VPSTPTILEIGVDNGNSIDLWSDYFVKPKLYAIDIDQKAVPEWVSFAQVDQSNPTMLDSYASDKNNLFDIILDDGSHIPEHQILTLNKLWKCLKPGGCYVIEDIETCYWKRSKLYGYRFDARKKHLNIMKNVSLIVQNINSEYLAHKPQPSRTIGYLDDIDMAIFGTNSVCFIKKNPAEFGKYYNRAYRDTDAVDSMSPYRRLGRLVGRLIQKT